MFDCRIAAVRRNTLPVAPSRLQRSLASVTKFWRRTGKTFYPIQFDNLNVVETFGRNSRVAFPYQRINKLRAIPPAERRADGMLTYVYHLFPNVMVATFPNNIAMVVLPDYKSHFGGTGRTHS